MLSLQILAYRKYVRGVLKNDFINTFSSQFVSLRLKTTTSASQTDLADVNVNKQTTIVLPDISNTDNPSAE